MSLFLLLIPIVVVIGSLLIYRFIGKAEILKFDVVQFLYAFILTPLIFVWCKVLLYLLLKNSLQGEISNAVYLVIDSSYSVLFLYYFGFTLIHSLTKTVSLRVSENPSFNIFNLLEYFHLWLSHIVFFGGSLVLFSIFGLLNMQFPLDISMTWPVFVGVISLGLLTGWMSFIGILLADPRQEGGYHFMRLMKVLIGILFLCFMIGYFIFEPKLAPPFLIYWLTAVNITVMALCAFASYRSVRAKNWLEKLSDKLKHPGFNFRAQLK